MATPGCDPRGYQFPMLTQNCILFHKVLLKHECICPTPKGMRIEDHVDRKSTPVPSPFPPSLLSPDGGVVSFHKLEGHILKDHRLGGHELGARSLGGHRLEDHRSGGHRL